MERLLEIEKLHLTRRSTGSAYRLEVAGLSLEQGACLALLGPSGSGKSTLMDILALALRPDGAQRFAMRIGGRMRDIQAEWQQGGRRLDAVRAGHIGYVLQTGALLPFLTVRANIELPARIGGKPAAYRATELAERLGVADQLRKLPGTLSVGQRQRVAIARALVHRPGLVLADEPTSSLDPLMAETVLDLLIDQVATEGATLVVATHDHAAVRRVRMPSIDLVMQPADGSGLAVARALASPGHS